MKITMYELLGLLKDCKAPKKIKIDNIIYELDEEANMYFTKMENCRVALGGLEEEVNLIYDAFENKVEILEEEKKIPEKITNKFHYTGEEEEFAKKINEIIDYLKSKGE
jgi:hypothetical protein